MNWIKTNNVHITRRLRNAYTRWSRHEHLPSRYEILDSEVRDTSPTGIYCGRIIHHEEFIILDKVDGRKYLIDRNYSHGGVRGSWDRIDVYVEE